MQNFIAHLECGHSQHAILNGVPAAGHSFRYCGICQASVAILRVTPLPTETPAEKLAARIVAEPAAPATPEPPAAPAVNLSSGAPAVTDECDIPVPGFVAPADEENRSK